MRKVIAAISVTLLFIGLTARAQFAAQWYFQDPTQTPQGIKQVYLTGLWNVTVVGTTNINVGLRQSKQTDTHGSLIVSNMVYGGYRVEFITAGRTNAFTNCFDVDISTNSLVNAADYICVGTNTTSSSDYAYTRAQTDALIAGVDGGGGEATNAYQSQVSGVGLTLSTNLTTFVYTFTLSAALQGWSAVTVSAYSNAIQSYVQGNINTTSNTLAALSQTIANSSSNAVLANAQTAINTSSNSVIGSAQTAINASSNSIVATDQSAINTSSNSVFGSALTQINATSNSLQSQITSGGVTLTQLNTTSNSVYGNALTQINTTSNTLAGLSQTISDTTSNLLQAKVNSASNTLNTAINSSSNSVLGNAQTAINASSNSIVGQLLDGSALPASVMVKTGPTTNLVAAAEGTDYASAGSTNTFTYKTYDAAAAGNVLKQIKSLKFLFPRLIDGAGCTYPNTNDFTANTFMVPLFSGTAATNANYCRFAVRVPNDIDTSVDLTASLTISLSAGDTGTNVYQVGMISIANSAAAAGTAANFVSLVIPGDASGASGDVESVSGVTLTSWKSNVTAGQWWLIELRRAGDNALDNSTVASYLRELEIFYTSTQ